MTITRKEQYRERSAWRDIPSIALSHSAGTLWSYDSSSRWTLPR